jgi:Xaa-Pro dipeptidase
MVIATEEYRSRLRRIREGMADAGLDGLLVYSWKRGQVRYVSGYTPNYVANVAMVVIPQWDDPTLLIRFPFDLGRARSMCWFDDVRASGTLADMGRDAVSRLRELQLDGAVIGLVSGDDTMDELPYTFYQQLSADLPRVRFCDARTLLMSERLIKSAAEFHLLRQSAAVADGAVAAAASLLAPGVSEREVVSAAEAAARSAGADDSLVAIASRSGEEQIGPPEAKLIQPGRLVIIEAAVQVQGYWTQVARGFAVGEPTEGQAAIYSTTFRAYQAAVQACTVGTPLQHMHQAAHSVLRSAGYADNVKPDMGHGIGLDLPEPPRVEAEALMVTEQGMVLVLHPAVRVPGVGGAFVGGTVLVTDEGAMPLHEIPERLT